tara:strand:- start:3816 stop:4463 length:648 start_codon:yes stop_codon:yes gene_type:complete
MNDNLFQAQYDLTKKSRIRKFYEERKYLIFILIAIILAIIISISFYVENKKNKIILLSDSYVEAKIYLQGGKRDKAKNKLQEIIFAKDSTYSSLALFLMIKENLLENDQEKMELFNHILENNKFDKEVKNLIILKKVLSKENFINESELLEGLNPLLSSESLWKPHALLFIGDYFFFNKEYLKAKDFYTQILNIKNLHKDLYEQAKSQIALINND